MNKLVEIEDFSCLSYICGPQDKNLKFLEKELSVTLSIKPQGLLIKGAKVKVEIAEALIKKIEGLSKEGLALDHRELKHYLGLSGPGKKESRAGKSDKKPAQAAIRVPSARKKFVFPKTEGQQVYIDAIRSNDIVFSTGPAGTGKTYLAMAMAVNHLMERKVRRIILARPAVEAGESLGFLPGDLREKLAPYLRPLYDALYDMIEAEVVEDHLETGVIEIVPLAYMRGRTLNNAFIILDEAQNCTSVGMRMFLTRLGFDSKTVITGDITQSDLPGGRPVGYREAMKLLGSVEGIEFINLGKQDVVRHPLTQKIIEAYENLYSQKEI